MQFFLRTIIATITFTYLAPTHTMFRTLMHSRERRCIEPLVHYLEETGSIPLPESDLATTYLRCYHSLSRLKKQKETIAHQDPDSYLLSHAPIKHSNGAVMGMLHCSREPNQPAKCLVEVRDIKRKMSRLEPANPALFDLLAIAHALQTRNSQTSK